LAVRLREEVIRDAARDREMQRFPAVEAQAVAAGLWRPINDQRMRARAPDREWAPRNVSNLDLEHAASHVVKR